MTAASGLAGVSHPPVLSLGLDQRARSLSLTKVGAKLLKAALPIVESTDVAFFKAAHDEQPAMLKGFRQLLAG